MSDYKTLQIIFSDWKWKAEVKITRVGIHDKMLLIFLVMKQNKSGLLKSFIGKSSSSHINTCKTIITWHNLRLKMWVAKCKYQGRNQLPYFSIINVFFTFVYWILELFYLNSIFVCYLPCAWHSSIKNDLVGQKRNLVITAVATMFVKTQKQTIEMIV